MLHVAPDCPRRFLCVSPSPPRPPPPPPPPPPSHNAAPAAAPAAAAGGRVVLQRHRAWLLRPFRLQSWDFSWLNRYESLHKIKCIKIFCYSLVFEKKINVGIFGRLKQVLVTSFSETGAGLRAGAKLSISRSAVRSTSFKVLTDSTVQLRNMD